MKAVQFAHARFYNDVMRSFAASGMSKYEVGQRAGISDGGTIANLFTHGRVPRSLDIIATMCAVFDLRLSDYIYSTGDLTCRM